MSNQNRTILENLHTLISYNVIGDKQYDFRYKGFRGELEFYAWFRKNRDETHMHSGGYLLPVISGKNALDNPIYFTTNASPPTDIDLQIYKSISKLACLKMFYIQYDDSVPINDWECIDVMSFNKNIPVPEFIVYEYNTELSEFISSNVEALINSYKKLGNRSKNSYPITNETKLFHINSLLNYETKDLLNIYVDRLLFDGYIGFGREKGIPTDIDLIVESRNGVGDLQLLEIKEKDLSKRAPQGFGMDVSRSDDITNISHVTGLPYLYIVRRVDNQQDRNFLEWLTINMDVFANAINNVDVIEGGTGMRSINSSNPTKVCPYGKFKRFG